MDSDKIEQPKILVLLSSYCGEKYIAEQLDSILSQKNVDLKIICRDDCSKDCTRDIIKKYVENYPQKIELIEGENLGFALSFTELLKFGYEKHPDIQYFAFADQDDVWLPDKLERGIKNVSSFDPAIPVAYCSNTTLVDENLNFLGKGHLHPVNLTKAKALIQNIATGCTMVMNRKAVELYVTHLPEEIKVHDFLMFQICSFLGKVIYDSESRILYRQHHNNQIGSPDFIGRMKKRLKGNFSKSILLRQNQIFLNAFGSLLTDEDKILFNKFINYNKSFINKLKLLLDKEIKYNNRETDFFLSLKILLGTL